MALGTLHRLIVGKLIQQNLNIFLINVLILFITERQELIIAISRGVEYSGK